jgi:hypothetical protein
MQGLGVSGEGDRGCHPIHFASQVIVQKQQMYLGAKRTPPGKSGRALQLPRACIRCGCFTTCTGHGGNSSKRLLKDRPTQADQQIPNQTTAMGLPCFLNPVAVCQRRVQSCGRIQVCVVQGHSTVNV